MGTYRKRFNEKARSGHMARLKELKRVRNKQFHRDEEKESDHEGSKETTQADPNAEILQPQTRDEIEQKKRKLEELFVPKESKVSRLKKKRLDKFIEHQLKREERKTIIDKMQDYKMDTSVLTSSKNLGHGKRTKKEIFAEALDLEKQGRGNEETKQILYEEHEVKNWEEDHGEDSESSEGSNDDEGFESKFGDSTTNTKSSFVDNRPAKFGGSGKGFAFSNVQVIKKTDSKPSKKKYNWRQRIEQQEHKAKSKDDEMDFDTDESEEEVSSQESNSYDSSFVSNSADEGSLAEDSSNDGNNNGLEEDAEDVDETPVSNVALEFKKWANSEIKKMEGRDVEVTMPVLSTKRDKLVRPEDLEDGLETTYIPVNESSKRKAFYVQVTRPDKIQEIRMQLPILAEEQKIMEAIHHNDVVVICGETGSGKTTQVPQFLFESGFGNDASDEYPGMIGITQPRRVAAVSMAKRVSQEMGDHGHEVAYQIRFDSSTKDNTKVKFMTDGVLLREMMNDFKLTKYSSIVIDEAHERNINTDILIGMLSRCVRFRAKEHAADPANHKRLKLIVMSATLRVSDFSENTTLFSTPPPILNVSARQFPVSVHFNRTTPFDYAGEAFRKACKIHRRLPPGVILIFMTGQQEIIHIVKKLRKEFPFPKKRIVNDEIPTVKINSKNADLEAEDIDFSVQVIDEEKFNADFNNEVDEDVEFEGEEGFEEALEEGQTPNDPLYVLPLYSLLPTSEQMKVFEKPPAGSRLCVVATNVAETSLTIPGVRYVVDCGRSKERKYNEENGVQSFEISWVSKASANQRSGRAGRTGPGHCYRLFSSAVFERDFNEFSRPEILRMPVESVVLQMKSMAIHNIVNFPFPTPPDRHMLSTAIELLKYLGALDDKERITDDGKKMSVFPLSPRFSKMLLVSNEQNCLPYIVSIVSALSVGDPFINEYELGIQEKIPQKIEDGEEEQDNKEFSLDDETRKKLRVKFYKSRVKFGKLDRYSDIFRLLSVVNAVDYIPKTGLQKFIADNFLRGKVMEEITKLRKQLTYIIKSNLSRESVAVSVTDSDMKTDIPNETQLKLLKQMIGAGFVDRVAIRADSLFPEDAEITNRSSIAKIPYVPVMAQKKNIVEETFVYIHPTSILNNLGELPPKYIVYSSLHLGGNSKTRMNALCDIKSTPLANIARKGQLLSFSKPLTGQGLKIIDLSPTERYCYVIPRFGSPVDSDLKIGWDLNPIPVHQVKENGRWIVDKFITNKSYKSMENSKR
ncbi:ATP-dependent RNA helicase ECM16 KNAG_0A06020 [Huiozyma naganishii CBS 8797]|uniref:RNA helicase n=1 Tax=Huiozyma naganishii (strain ATCC MYA-139 / BCRC 22969 / CBS 8797 / KCTC 17520 / NBRC 10181 / NCYC 3082 / Yp74L-3) TaxID=1071383 RepID=J7S2M9_HUIN7|nr:hypothetical protein KNAG_0A06020 [Kazachstania naganishii CBS 8797]CCK68264.1 hypothetical protein KNAG_0A06020 [Kazachstania naganishii CBS 8797]